MIDADPPADERSDTPPPQVHQPIRRSEQRGAFGGRQCDLCEEQATTQSADLILCDHHAEMARQLVDAKRGELLAHVRQVDAERHGDSA
jgi:hypothetical protein